MAMKNGTICIVRNYVRPRITDHNVLVGNKLKAANRLFKQIHSDFLADLVAYKNAYNSQLLPENKLPISAQNIFIKAVCSHHEVIPTLSGPGSVSDILGGNISDWIASESLPSLKANFTNADIISGV
jgi:hypothetical protein